MRPINELEFEIREAQTSRKHHGLRHLIKRSLPALKPLIQNSNDPIHLSAQLRRDAGIDDLEIERTTLARAPLIR